MQSRLLTKEEKRNLALTALRSKRGDKEYKTSVSCLDELVKPVRKEDDADNLWNVFNTIQEKITKGDYTIESKNGRVRRAMPIKSVFKDINFNQMFFKEAASMVAA